jgi:diguanylate cyclase (GGDEF)-like protein/PAS domain S-box-containing protein
LYTPDDNYPVSDPDAVEDPVRLVALQSLLAANPQAPIATIGFDGLIVPRPAEVEFDGHPDVDARSVFDMVVAEDRLPVSDSWDRAINTGASTVTVHLIPEPGRAVSVQFFDLRDQVGYLVAVFVAQDEDGFVSAAATTVHQAPRLATVYKDERSVIASIDEAVTRMLGWEPSDMVGERSLGFIHPDDQQRAIESWMEMLTSNVVNHRTRLRHKRKDGSWLWVEIVNTNRLSDPEHSDVEAQLVDITAEMEAQEALRAREQLLDRLAQSLPLGLFQIDPTGQVVYTNERLHEIVGRPRTNAIDEQMIGVVEEDQPLLNGAILSVLEEGIDRDVEIRLTLPGRDDHRLCRVTLRALTSEDGEVTGAIACIDDVTESAHMRIELEHRATYDVLTRCHNRGSVMSLLEKTLETATDDTSGTAVVFIDLDKFKPINDRLGHAVGDELLKVVADRLRSAVRGDDIVGRIGGDEFLIVLPTVADHHGAMVIANRISDLMHKPVDVQAGRVELRASIGVAWTNAATVGPDLLVAEGDAAMYESKRQGVGQPVLYASTLHRRHRSGVDDERWVKNAMSTGDLTIHYQPMVEVESGTVVGYEAFLRGVRDGEVIPAGEFIELAEQMGVIHDIGRWVIDEVCRTASIENIRDPELRWSINVSPLQIAAGGLAETITTALSRNGLEPDRLMIELVEHEILGASPIARATMAALDSLGVGIVIDDFGTGWSSLKLLRELPICGLKVNRALTADLAGDDRSTDLVGAIFDLARRLDLAVFVEGIETEEERRSVLELGGRLGQGDLFSPVSGPGLLFGHSEMWAS